MGKYWLLQVLMKFFMFYWMCCNKTSDNRISQLHIHARRMVYNDNVSICINAPEKYNSVTIHVRNIRILVTELYNAKKNLVKKI